MKGALAARVRIAAVAAIACVLAWGAPARAADDVVTIGSKNFSESRLLAEMFAQAIEARTDLEVDRRFNLAGTQVCLEALRTGAIDLYPEYTGTGLVSILGEPADRDRADALRRVRRAFADRWNLVWLPPLGFENAYELAVPEALAAERGLRTISDLAEVAGELRAGLGYEFVERPDGLPGLRETYGLEFGSVRTLQQTLKYEAVASGTIDCLDVYGTDGRLLEYDLRVLDDDRGFFPPYEAAPLARGALLDAHPEVALALTPLSNAIDAETMRGWNLRVQERDEPVERVARDALTALGYDVGGDASAADVRGAAGEPVGDRPGFWTRVVENRGRLLRWTLEHLALSAIALVAAVLVALPLALFLERRRTLAEPLIRVVGSGQTIPSIALFAFMVPLLGIGVVPALVALWVYALFPILRNAYTGLRDAPAEVVAAAEALGMTPGQILRRVRLPLALPVILAGVRTSAVLTVGAATLAAFIGAGGLGVPIVAGLQLADAGRILLGAVPAALLALAVDRALHALERLWTPKGLS